MKNKMKGRKWNSISHSIIYKLIQEKTSELNINVEIQEESYTSKSSFFDCDEVKFSGIRKNKIYTDSKNNKYDSDLHACFNIFKKYYDFKFNKDLKYWRAFVGKSSSFNFTLTLITI